MSYELTKRYRVVDVFTDKPFEGNPLAVFPDASGLDTDTMQKIAKELNLSETTFVFPATREDCAAKVRIFTPGQEMDFAGHPTIGTSYVLMDEGIIPDDIKHFILEERIGPVPIKVDRGESDLIWLQTPPIITGQDFDSTQCAQVLGLEASDLLDITPQILSAGNPVVFIPVEDKAAVDDSYLDHNSFTTLKSSLNENICVFVFTPTTEGAYSRMFAPDHGVPEDPATGSATGPLALYMMQHGLVSNNPGTRFISEQGTKMGRKSLLHVHILGHLGQDGIFVGGNVTPVADCSMRIY